MCAATPVPAARAGRAPAAAQGAAPLIALTIRDNGVGFDAENHQPGYGLRGMQERISALGGSLRFTAERGACLSVILPTVSPAQAQN